jgi:hypothetical protein
LVLGGIGGAGPAPRVGGSKSYYEFQGSSSQWARSGLADSVQVWGGVIAMMAEASEASRYRVVVFMVKRHLR